MQGHEFMSYESFGRRFFEVAVTEAVVDTADDWDVGSLVDWVETSLLPVYVRPVDRTALHWCPTWWLHMEAWARFEACQWAKAALRV